MGAEIARIKNFKLRDGQVEASYHGEEKKVNDSIRGYPEAI